MKNPQAIIVLLSLLQCPNTAKNVATIIIIMAVPVKSVHDLELKVAD